MAKKPTKRPNPFSKGGKSTMKNSKGGKAAKC